MGGDQDTLQKILFHPLFSAVFLLARQQNFTEGLKMKQIQMMMFRLAIKIGDKLVALAALHRDH